MAASKGASAARNEILEILTEDHKAVKKLFREFDKIDSEDTEEMESLVSLACAELKLHTQLEEECFYPQVRQALKEADIVDEAEVEHMSAKQLIEQIEGMSADDPKFRASFKVLGEYVKHHIKEEESEMFPQLQRARIDWEALLEQMNNRRAELESELGLSEEEETEGEEATQVSGQADTRAPGTAEDAEMTQAEGEGGHEGRGKGRGKKESKETIE